MSSLMTESSTDCVATRTVKKIIRYDSNMFKMVADIVVLKCKYQLLR